MGAVFDGKTKVGRAVADPGTDDMLPNPGSMALGAIATPVSLSGTIGAHCMLVHGDRWQQITGNFTESVGSDVLSTVTGNQTHTVSGNQTATVSGNHSETIMGNTLQTMIGPQIVSNMDVRNETRAVTHLHTHGDNFFQYDPSNKFMFSDTNMTACIFMFEAEVEHTEIGLHHLEFKPIAHNYFSGIETAISLTKDENEPMTMRTALLALHLMAAKPGVTAFESKMGALQPKVIACAPMAGVDPNMTPMI